MFRRIKSGWRLTKKSWGVLAGDPGLVRFPVLAGLAGLLFGVLFLIPGAYYIESGPEAIGIVLVAIGTYLIAFLNYYFAVGLAACADLRMRGEEISFSRGMSVASSRMSAIAGWAFVATVVMTIVRAIQERFGIAGAILGSLAAAAWGLVTFLAVPVIALEGTGPIATIKRCGSLLKSRWGEQITGTVAIGGAVFLLGVLPGTLFLVGGIFLWATTGIGGAILIAIGVVILIVALLVQQALATIFGVALYRYTVDGEAVATFTADDLESAVRRKGGMAGPASSTI
ncbi:MAG: DUF6159 family protein [Solirubrobacterales bacterium]|nr:DUF6159 family protein [Solirubrobacterales bacterium]